MQHRILRKRGIGAIVLTLATSLLAFASSAAASATPPFHQCPVLGFDTSCQILIEVLPSGSLQSYKDPSQGPFDGVEDTLIGVQNNSPNPVTHIALKGANIFGFDGDGLCSGKNESGGAGFEPPPAGCPFGPTGYEGPGTEFTIANTEEGTVNFTGNGIPPGGTAYFSLEGQVEFTCEVECVTVEPTTLSTTLSGGGVLAESITVPEGTPVSDTAALAGKNAPIATGTVEYNVYSNDECTNLVASAGSVSVSGGIVPASNELTLAPGTYYWQASYGGDTHNGKSKSACGSEVETVLPPACTTVVGVGHYGERGPGGLNLDNNLNTSLVGKQQFEFTSPFGHMHLSHLLEASCVAIPGGLQFTGFGIVKYAGVSGDEMFFQFSIVGSTTYLTAAVFGPGGLEFLVEEVPLRSTSHERIF